MWSESWRRLRQKSLQEKKRPFWNCIEIQKKKEKELNRLKMCESTVKEKEKCTVIANFEFQKEPKRRMKWKSGKKKLYRTNKDFVLK